MEAGKGAHRTFFCGMVFFCVLICFVKCEKVEETTIAEALAKWETKTGMSAAEAKEMNLYGQYPAIKRMDSSLSILEKCEKLSLSSNEIETIENLDGLKSLKSLSVGRNNIRTLEGLEPVKDTLEELWISYNSIEKLDGVTVLKKLKVLYISNNAVKTFDEVERLAELPLLEDLLLVGNPLEERLSSEGNYRDEITKVLGSLKKLDGVPVVRTDEDEEQED